MRKTIHHEYISFSVLYAHQYQVRSFSLVDLTNNSQGTQKEIVLWKHHSFPRNLHMRSNVRRDNKKRLETDTKKSLERGFFWVSGVRTTSSVEDIPSRTSASSPGVERRRGKTTVDRGLKNIRENGTYGKKEKSSRRSRPHERRYIINSPRKPRKILVQPLRPRRIHEQLYPWIYSLVSAAANFPVLRRDPFKANKRFFTKGW